jgi:hypothetical protein
MHLSVAHAKNLSIIRPKFVSKHHPLDQIKDKQKKGKKLILLYYLQQRPIVDLTFYPKPFKSN